MARESLSFGAYKEATLTDADVRRLVRQNSLTLREGDRGYVLEGTKIYSRDILDEDGSPKITKEGNIIRELSTIMVVQRKDGALGCGRVTLSWISGDDLFTEDHCPLLYCKDNVRKYAATWKLTRVQLRDFAMNLTAGQTAFNETFAFIGAGAIEGYKAPALDDVWVKSTAGGYINKDGLGDSIALQKVLRSCLQSVDVNPSEDAELYAKLRELRDRAAAKVKGK